MISGGVAKPLLEASGLSLPILGEIWNLSDSENTGFLNQFSFCVAMRLIAHAQRGDPITLTSANSSAPLAKFRTIQVNNTGSGVLNSHLSNPLTTQLPSGSPSRITSSNSVQSFASLSSNNSNPSLVVPLLSPIQAKNFGAMFDKTASNGILPGSQAKNIFLKARLPIPVLEQIWNLVDQNETGQLTRPQFIVAMHLIQCFMNKSLTVLPTALSDQLWKIAGSPSSASPQPSPVPAAANYASHPAPISPPPSRSHTSLAPPQVPSQQPHHAQTVPLKQQTSGGNVVASPTTNLNTWIMSSEQKKQYGSIFETLDTQHQNFISSSTVANFLMTSKLPNQVLASIWELANLDQSENFSKQEFSIAMYLVQKKLAGYELPEETPSELIQSSSFDTNTTQPQPVQQVPPPQSFASAKAQAAPQRTASHMDDLLGIFQTAAPVASPPQPTAVSSSSSTIPQHQQVQHSHTLPPPAPASRLPTSMEFHPTSNFGQQLQKSVVNEEEDEEDSSDDEEGPENLDLPRVRGTAPVVPGRSSKPHFDSEENVAKPQQTSNYDAIKTVTPANDASLMFSNQPATASSANAALGGFTNTASAGMGAAAGAAIGFTGATAASSGFSNSTSASNDRAITDQITQTSVDIANYSNQVSSLSKQTSVVSGRKDKAQNELNKILKKKDEIANKLVQLKALHEKETQQVTEVQNLLVKSKGESDELAKELSIVEANYHAEQTKKEQLQAQYDESQKSNQALKEKLGTLNAENIDLKNQIDDLNSKVTQAKNMVAVVEQQVVTQEAENNELKQKVADLNNSIFQIQNRHTALLNRIAQLNDENLDLHEEHTDLSIQSANKNVEYSETLADAAAKGIVGDELDDAVDAEEVPTASLDDFDDDFTSESQSKGKEISKPESQAAVPATETIRKEISVSESAPKSEKLTNTPSIVGPATLPPDSPVSTASDTSMSKQTDITIPTQTLSDATASATGQQFSLPFGTPHSETSSTRNNPSQSERGDIDASTIEQTGPLSSQVLPEGTVTESGDSESSQEKTESFEFINHPVETQHSSAPFTPPATLSHTISDTTGTSSSTDGNTTTDISKSVSTSSIPVPARTSMAAAVAAAGMTSPIPHSTSFSGQTSEVETLSDTQQEHPNETPELDEFPPIRELEPLADESDSSSSDEGFHDATLAEDDLQPAEEETAIEDSKNPFDSQQNSASPEHVPAPPANVATGPSMFDDLGLEEAQVEAAGTAFDSPGMGNGGFSNIGFTYNDANVPATDANVESSGVGDDWEQVFAGFGNDPNLQPATVEENNISFDNDFQSQPAVFGFSADAGSVPATQPSSGLDQTVQKDINKASSAIHSSFSEAQQLAIEELTDMGFNKEDSISALNMTNWNIDDASNYLLDKA